MFNDESEGKRLELLLFFQQKYWKHVELLWVMTKLIKNLHLELMTFSSMIGINSTIPFFFFLLRGWRTPKEFGTHYRCPAMCTCERVYRSAAITQKPSATRRRQQLHNKQHLLFIQEDDIDCTGFKPIISYILGRISIQNFLHKLLIFKQFFDFCYQSSIT